MILTLHVAISPTCQGSVQKTCAMTIEKEETDWYQRDEEDEHRRKRGKRTLQVQEQSEEKLNLNGRDIAGMWKLQRK